MHCERTNNVCFGVEKNSADVSDIRRVAQIVHQARGGEY